MKLTCKRVYLIFSSAMFLGIISCLPKNKMKVEEQTETVYAVKSQSIKKSDLQEYLTFNGNVRADNTIAVFPDTGGKLVSVPVTLGSYVKKGQVMAKVDSSKPGANYLASPVTAPIEGYVTSLPLTTGTTVSTSTEIARIGNIQTLQIEAKIPESKIGFIKNGLTAQVSIEAYKDETFPAHVFRISPIVDETSRTKEIYLLFDTKDERINAGMFVRIKLNTCLHKDIIAIPHDCILTENQKSYVFVLNEDSTVSKREISCGVTVDSSTEVLGGLSENEKIIVSGMQVLIEGVKVRNLSEQEAK